MITLKEVIEKLEDVDCPKSNALVWVGKNYSKQDLIEDLKKLKEEEDSEGFDDTAQAPGNSCY